jgi:hypothetical protein
LQIFTFPAEGAGLSFLRLTARKIPANHAKDMASGSEVRRFLDGFGRGGAGVLDGTPATIWPFVESMWLQVPLPPPACI